MSCVHVYHCIYRHPTSDLKCQKCGDIITHDQHVFMMGMSEYAKDKSLLEKAKETMSKLEAGEKVTKPEVTGLIGELITLLGKQK